MSGELWVFFAIFAAELVLLLWWIWMLVATYRRHVQARDRDTFYLLALIGLLGFHALRVVQPIYVHVIRGVWPQLPALQLHVTTYEASAIRLPFLVCLLGVTVAFFYRARLR